MNVAATDREFTVLQQDLGLTSAQSAAGQGFGFTWPAEFPAVRLDDLLSRRKIEQLGLFHPGAVTKLVEKFEAGTAIGIKDNMAMVGIISTSLLQEEFCKS